MLQEGNHGGRHRHHLAGGNVHQVNVLGRNQRRFATGHATQHVFLDERTVLLQFGRGLGDVLVSLVVSGDVADFFGDLAVLDHAIGSLDETEGVDPRESRQRTDQADVRAFRGFNGAHASVVRGVHVADLHTRAVTAQTAGAQRRETTLVGQAGQRVVLVHELRQLRSAKELFDGRHDGTDINQRVRGDGFHVLSGHAFAHHAFHAGHTGAHLQLDQFAHRAHAAVTEVVDVIGRDPQLGGLSGGVGNGDGVLSRTQGQQIAESRHDVAQVQDALFHIRIHPQLFVNLVAANFGQIIALGVGVEVVQQGSAGFG